MIMAKEIGKDELLEMMVTHLDCVCELFQANDCAIKKLHSLLMNSDIPYLVLPDSHHDFMIIYLNLHGNEGEAGYRITHDPAGRDWLQISTDDGVMGECMSASEVFGILKEAYERDTYVNENGFFDA